MWPNPQSPADLVTFTEETLSEKLHFLGSDLFNLRHFQKFKNDKKKSVKMDPEIISYRPSQS